MVVAWFEAMAGPLGDPGPDFRGRARGLPPEKNLNTELCFAPASHAVLGSDILCWSLMIATPLQTPG